MSSSLLLKPERLERGGPRMLTVETEVKGYSKSTNEWGRSVLP
jgi:hypothetical protein